MDIYQRLLEHWQQAGVAVNPPVSSEEVAHFQQRRVIRLPESFRKYLAAIGGMEQGETDEQMISFLTLPQIEANTSWKPKAGQAIELVFAEFLIFSHTYAIRISEGESDCPVYAIDGTHELFVADSFEEFLEEYIQDAQAIADCMARASSV